MLCFREMQVRDGGRFCLACYTNRSLRLLKKWSCRPGYDLEVGTKRRGLTAGEARPVWKSNKGDGLTAARELERDQVDVARLGAPMTK